MPEVRRYSHLNHSYFNNDDNLDTYKVALGQTIQQLFTESTMTLSVSL